MDRKSPAPHIFEIDKWERVGGDAFKAVQDGFVGDIATEPICYRGALQLVEEMAARLDGTNSKAAATSRAFRDCGCSEWTPYKQGRSPMEHAADFDMLRLEQERREFEERMQLEGKDFDLWLTERNEAFQRRLSNVANKLLVAAIAIALIIGAAQIIVAIIVSS